MRRQLNAVNQFLSTAGLALFTAGAIILTSTCASAQTTTPVGWTGWPSSGTQGLASYPLFDPNALGLSGVPNQYHAIHDDIPAGTYNSITFRGWSPSMQLYGVTADMQIDVSWGTTAAINFAAGTPGTHHNGTRTTVYARNSYTFTQQCSTTCFNPPFESGQVVGPLYTLNFANPITVTAGGSFYIHIFLWSVTGGANAIPLEGFHNHFNPNPVGVRTPGRHTGWAGWGCAGGTAFAQAEFELDYRNGRTALRAYTGAATPTGVSGTDWYLVGPLVNPPVTVNVNGTNCNILVQNLATYFVPWGPGPSIYSVDLFNVGWIPAHNNYSTFMQVVRIDSNNNIIALGVPAGIATHYVDPAFGRVGCMGAQMIIGPTSGVAETGVLFTMQ